MLEGPGEGSGNWVYLENWKIAGVPAAPGEAPRGRAAKVVVEDRQGGPIGGHLRLAIVEASKIVHARAID